MKTLIMEEARATAGARERYAMEHGHKAIIYVHGNMCYKWTYGKSDKYQDANGATYDTARKCWID